MRIVSIDPGTVNCGYAVWENGKYIQFGSHNLLAMVDKKKQTDYPYIARVFADKTKLFEGADIILIENQMQARMKLIACSLRCFFWDVSVPISPLAVRKYFKISNGNYRKNKKDSKEFVHKILTKEQGKQVLKSKKKDDLADAVIQLQYYIEKNNIC
jgi:Holliday junction resolvasome RuvABC endonuclease subunit